MAARRRYRRVDEDVAGGLDAHRGQWWLYDALAGVLWAGLSLATGGLFFVAIFFGWMGHSDRGEAMMRQLVYGVLLLVVVFGLVVAGIALAEI